MSPMLRSPLQPRKCFRFSFLLGADSTPRAIVGPKVLRQWKIPVTPSAMEPATLHLVAQYATSFPAFYSILSKRFPFLSFPFLSSTVFSSSYYSFFSFSPPPKNFQIKKTILNVIYSYVSVTMYVVCAICASHCPYFVDKFFFYTAVRVIFTVK